MALQKKTYSYQKDLTESYLKMMEGQFLDISFEKEKIFLLKNI